MNQNQLLLAAALLCIYVSTTRAQSLHSLDPLSSDEMKKVVRILKDNSTIDDVVIWYVAGITHIVRPEEWPVMPAHHMGFSLMPFGFFSKNPTMAVPTK